MPSLKPEPGACAPDQASRIAVLDWDALFRAVEERLRQTVGVDIADVPGVQTADASARIQIAVLECVGALDKLHIALTNERRVRRHLEDAVTVLQATLAQVLSRLDTSPLFAAVPLPAGVSALSLATLAARRLPVHDC